jgi:DNA polymerase I-like protein with 3'-5' exonuclease and polymerase domains/5'-3' exonuclease
MYDILDFNAVTKHSYFGQVGRTQDILICPDTGKEVVNWHAAVNDFLSRYMETISSPRTLLVAHDMGREYRTAFFPDYKKKSEKDLEKKSKLEGEQIKLSQDWIKKFLAALGSTQIGVKGVEADDVIAWICEGQGIRGIVHTVDADLLNLVTDDIYVNLKGEMYTDYMGEFNGVPLNLTSISKAFLGDKSDKYPGIKGFGPAKFSDLLATLEVAGVERLRDLIEDRDIEAAQAFAEQYPDCKPLQTILENWSVVLDQWRLARLHPELCWKPRGRKLITPIVHKRVPNAQRVYDLLKEVGAQDLYKTKYSKMVPGILAVDAKNFVSVKEAIKKEMKAGDIIAYDYETTDKNQFARFKKASTVNFVDVLSSEITGISFCFGEYLQNVIYLTVDHKDSSNLTKEDVKELLQFVQDSGKTPVAHNAFFEGAITQKQLGLVVDNVHDTRVMQRYFNENLSAGLKFMSGEYLGYEQDSYHETLQKASDMNFLAAAGQEVDLEDIPAELLELRESTRCRVMSDITAEQGLSYGADDALVTAHLYDLMKLNLQLDKQWDFYKTWAVNPTQTLQSAFLHGVNINWALQQRLQKRDEETIERETAELRGILEVNVTGSVTEGCKSFLSEEKKFMEKRLRAQYGEEWYTHYANWEGRTKEACLYVPYEEYEMMPDFAFTASQITKAAEAVGLPVVEKTTLTFLNQYFEDLNLTSLEATEYVGEQGQFLELLQRAVEQRVDKLKADPTVMRQKAFDALAAFCQKVTKVEPKIVKIGDELSVTSPVQMQHLMYCKIGVPVRLFGKLGMNRMKLGIRQASPTTDEKAIQTALALDAKDWQVDALKCLLKIKSASTRLSLYHNKMPLWVHEDGKIHPYITDAGTDTRRPTGSAPNVLQIPARGDGKAMRSMYVPPSEDWVCVAIDYASQELILLGNMSGDPKMIEAFKPGFEKDVHSMTGVGIAVKMAIDNPDLLPLTTFEGFMEARLDEHHPLHAEAESIRGSKAKACIAEGSLVLTDSGLVEIEKVTIQHKVWDGIEFVNHEGVIYKGIQNVITYGALTATPDHEVFLNDNSKEQFSKIRMEQAQSRIMVGEIGGRPVTDSRGYLNLPLREVCKGGDEMQGVRSGGEQTCEQPTEGQVSEMQLPKVQVENPSTEEFVRTLQCTGPEMQQPAVSVLQELRSQGSAEQLREYRPLCELDSGELTAPDLQGRSAGPNRQQRALRARELETGNAEREPLQQEDQRDGDLQRSRGGAAPCLGPNQDGSSRVPSNEEYGSQTSGQGENSRRDGTPPTHNTWRSPVYDIVNAGPRNRFTVSGVVVSNCNFGIAYGGGAFTLARNLIVSVEEAEVMLDGTLSLYARIPEWQQETAKFMNQNGFTKTSFGTKRHATDDIFSKEKGLVSRMHRQGINSTIQGTAAESLRIVLTRMHTEGWLNSLRMQFFAPIYDEIVAFVHKGDVVKYWEVMKKLMVEATPPGHEIPQVPELAVGSDWGRCHEIGRNPTSEGVLKAVEVALEEAAEMWATDMKLSFEDVYGRSPEEFAA